MNLYYAMILSTIAGLSTIIGSLIVFIKIKNINKFISICLSFTATIMIGLSIIELIPESFMIFINKYSLITTLIFIFITIIVSLIIITIVNKCIKNTNNLYKIGILNMIVLMLHNFPEGITTFITSYHDINIGIKMTIAIALHNIPEGIAISSPIYAATKSRKKAIIKTFISGLSEPLGAIFAYIFVKNYINDYLIAYILLVVASLMITLSIEKLLPEASTYNKDKCLKIGFILGILILVISLFIL